MQWKAEAALVELGAEPGNSIGEYPFDFERQIGHPEVEQLLIAEFGPILA